VLRRYRQRRGLTAMVRHEGAEITFSDMVAGANAGDLVALAVLQEMAKYLGIGIANLVNVFNPQLVVLGGALSQAGEQVIPLIKETVKQSCLFPMRANLSIVPSRHGMDDCVLGAVALVIEDLMRLPS
jgi:predicted NBD/HSP70 family sugar kinase